MSPGSHIQPSKASQVLARICPAVIGPTCRGYSLLPGARRFGREQRDRLLDIGALAFRAGMFLLALGIAPHHFEQLAAISALELIHGHGVRPPQTTTGRTPRQ